MKSLILILFLSLSVNIFAQQQDNFKLAMKYFESQEYDKASVLFDKLYKKRKSKYYFDYYIDCLINQKKYTKAEKRIKKEMKKRNDITFYIDLGYVYEKEGKGKNAEKEYKYVLNNLKPDIGQIANISNSFIRRKKYDYAEKVLLKGNKWFNNRFWGSLIAVYSLSGNKEKMIDAYLNFVFYNNKQLAYVEKNFASFLRTDANNEFSKMLENKLLQKIQNNGSDIYYELLIWFYLQKQNYTKALIFAKSIDMRNGENGARIYKIGQIAMQEENFTTAKNAFSYIKNKKGNSSPYYNKAEKMLLKIKYENVVATPQQYDINEIEKEYLSYLSQVGLNKNTVDVLFDLADLETFYLNKSDSALVLLKKAMLVSGLDNNTKGTLMIKTADVYLASGDPWNAILLYAKVEKNFPNNQIADEAKFKKAKTYFYVGMIDYAQEQWNILKGSPSKLIANDAIYWTTFIDEFSADSTHKVLKRYARADMYFFTRDYNKALAVCDSMLTENSDSPVIPRVLFLKAQIYEEKKNYQKAVDNLQEIADKYSYAMWTDKAIYLLAQLYETKLNDVEKAKEYYKKLMFDFQGSVYSKKAAEDYKKLLKAKNQQ